MTFIRPESLSSLHRWREAVAGGGVALFGLWTAWQGDTLTLPGLALTSPSASAGRLPHTVASASSRMARPRGIVRVTEAQIAYYGTRVGGFVGLPDLSEIRLLTLRGRRIWKLKQGDGQFLHIPVEADGAEALFDAFATLPGIDMAALVAALGSDAPPSDSRVIALAEVDRLIWARQAVGIVVH